MLALGVVGAQMASFDREGGLHPDEHVFILMAAHVLDGGLPNVGLVDIKPPLFFYLLAGAFALFGETLAVARLFGDLSIFALCVATFGVARRWTGPTCAGLGALLVVAATAGNLGQATLTDFAAMALLMGSLWAALAGRRSHWLAGWAGLLASAAVLVRLNLWVSAAALGAWLAFCACRRSGARTDWTASRPGALRTAGPLPAAHGLDAVEAARSDAASSRAGRRAGWASLWAFSAAGLALPLLFVFLYWRADALADLRFFTIDVPLSYSAQGSMGDAIESLVMRISRDLFEHRPILTTVFAAGMTAGAVSALQRLRGRPGAERAPSRSPLPAVQRSRHRPAAGKALRPSARPDSKAHATPARAGARGPHARLDAPDSNDELLLVLMAGAFCVALLTAGVTSVHYIYWGVPLGAVYAARGAERATAFAGRWVGPWPLRAPRIVFVVAVAATTILVAFGLRERAAQPRLVQPVRLAAEAIAADRRPGDGVWPLDKLIASWYLGVDSPLPLAFPWNLSAPAVLRPLVDSGRLPAQPLQAAMETAPAYLLVRSDGGGPFRPPGFIVRYDAGAAARLAQWVRDDYALFYDAGGVAVYKAKDRS